MSCEVCERTWPWSIECQACRHAQAREQRTEQKEKPNMSTGRITMAERERMVARRRGYTEDDLHSICKAREVRLIAFSEARAEQRAAQQAIEDEVEAVGRELGLDPATNYQDRRRVFDELVRRGHPIAREPYGWPASS